MSQERTEGEAPAQDSTTRAEKDSVLQADSYSCALPHPACSLLIPQGCAACLWLPREFPPASEFTQHPCCCPGRQSPGRAEQQLELGWHLAARGKSFPGRAGSTALAIPTPGAFSWESPAPWHCLCSLGVLGAAHTCTPMCARVCQAATAPFPEPWVLLLPPGDIPSWPGCSRSLCLWSISLPGSCYKRFLLSSEDFCPFCCELSTRQQLQTKSVGENWTETSSAPGHRELCHTRAPPSSHSQLLPSTFPAG